MVSRTLLLDCGNTACKYQYGEEHGHLDSTEAFVQLVERIEPEQTLLATVSKFGQTLGECLVERALPHRKVRVRPDWQGLKLAYAEPERLGVDRWLTLVALCGHPRPVMVVDVGTALKIDALDGGDRHLGGYILPGMRLMRRALVDDTFALPPVDQDGALAPGATTRDCIANGAVLALAGAVDKARAQFGPTPPDIVWTGGDADRVRPFTAEPGQLRPALIFEGMRRLMKDADYMESLA
ncbi:type III pantothenate kinase [Saccharospirillum salsuginis]|uniref:Type III pantothenate kinase n=1 Tax=Saccharospirillum salsuginis TaxID=418750 RepID=A0A918KU35_9GAMM|nr:type III pantothenate kinase [Saccharospirillum salsuginis]GGX76202.1 type III pantothenate kinase [Saccharospirillum salsuginis]